MENKMNIAELLKDCPKGMELDCTVYNNVTLEYVCNSSTLPICIRIQDRGTMFLSKYGQLSDEPYCKCIIFPKGKTTWEGFIPPCKFKNGDIISNGDYVAIFYKIETPCCCKSPNVVYYHCYYSQKWHNFKKELDFGIGISTEFKYATEEEKETLFKEIKANGYHWNPETKTLEKLIEPKFKVSDKIKFKDGNEFGIITQVSDCFYKIKWKNNTYCWPIKKQEDWELINEPKFKVGDSIKKKDSNEDIVLITDIADNYYIVETKYGMKITISINIQNNYELVPNKFDINTLKPFDRVLVRDNDEQMWTADMFSFYNEKHVYPFMCVGHYTNQCIPYDQNKHLLGTTDECNDYYKNWK